MQNDRVSPQPIVRVAEEPEAKTGELSELREILVGSERRQLEALRQRLDSLALDPEELAEHLPEAIALRAGRDRQLARALAPTIETAITESVRRNPQDIATAIFPVLGPAIRKAIAETMAGLINSINRAIEHSLSPRGIRWRIEAWRTGIPYAQIVIKHALIYRVEQVFLIHAETGLVLGHAAAPNLAVTDADLISGMLTAIQDFVGDSFQQEEGGKLRTFSVGELTVLVEPGPQAVIAAVVRGQAPESLLRKLQDTLETLHFQFAGPLAAFDGNATPFEAFRPMLEDCLETVLTTDDRGRASRTTHWRAWAVALALLTIVLAVLALRAQRQWDDALARLRTEPGIVLVRADRAGARWRFAGLKDPLAPDPSSALAQLNGDSTRVEARWEPYLSLDPKLVVERARRALTAPPTVALDLRGDSLIARGSASMPWVARVGALSVFPPGVSHFDVSGVEAVLPTEFAALKATVETDRVLFDAGSATPTPTTRGLLVRVAGAFGRLHNGTGEMGYRVELAIVGRTDPTGSDATNKALSQQRADVIRATLISLGVPAAVATATGIGTTSPLALPNPAEAARINRSVSFLVHLRPVTNPRKQGGSE